MNLLDQANSEGVRGFLHCDETMRLAELARDREILEVGAFCGLSAYCMAHTAKSVVSLDTYRAWTNGQTQGEEITTLDAYKKATARFPNVLPPIVATSEEGASIVTNDFDMIFIDADHTYEAVKADIVRWWPRVRMGGMLVFHDYISTSYPGVKLAVDEAFWEPAEDTIEMGLRWIEKRENVSTRVTIRSAGRVFCANYAEPVEITVEGQRVWRCATL